VSIIYRALKKLQNEREPGESGPVAAPPQETSGSSGGDSAPRKRTLILLGAVIFMLLLSAAGLKLVEIAYQETSPPPRPKRALPAVTVATKSPEASQPAASSKPVEQPTMAATEPEEEPESGDSPDEMAPTEESPTVATAVSVLPAAKPEQAAPVAHTEAEQPQLLAQTAATQQPVAQIGEPAGGLPPAESDIQEPLIIDDPLPSDPATNPEYGKYQRSSKKQAEAALVAARLQQAIRSNDQAGVDRALQQLARLKGRDSAYFLQMQAYWYLHSKRYDAAERTLIRALHKNPGSLHASLNMAVLESLTGREAAARDRLNALAERFPDNPEVKALQRRLD
jgi:tetratricopeptide (TPR) repeat protein